MIKNQYSILSNNNIKQQIKLKPELTISGQAKRCTTNEWIVTMQELLAQKN
jgi:hypothetical protein